jgi:hypothetical protein
MRSSKGQVRGQKGKQSQEGKRAGQGHSRGKPLGEPLAAEVCHRSTVDALESYSQIPLRNVPELILFVLTVARIVGGANGR